MLRLTFILSLLLLNLVSVSAADFTYSKSYFRNGLEGVNDIGTSGAFVDISSAYSIDNEDIQATVTILNTGIASGSIKLTRQGVLSIQGTPQKRCSGDSDWSDLTSLTNDVNTTSEVIASLAQNKLCKVKYVVNAGGSNDLNSIIQDVIKINDTGSDVKTLTMKLYTPFFDLSDVKDLGTDTDEIVLTFAETLDQATAEAESNFEIKVGVASFIDFSTLSGVSGAVYDNDARTITLTSNTNMFATGDAVQVKIKNLKTTYDRYLNTSDYTSASIVGINSSINTASDAVPPVISQALYFENAIYDTKTLDLIFSENIISTAVASNIKFTDASSLGTSPTLSWQNFDGQTYPVLHIDLGSGGGLVTDTTKVYINPASVMKDNSGNNIVTIDADSSILSEAGRAAIPNILSFTIADNSDNNNTTYTNNQIIAVTAFTSNAFNEKYLLNQPLSIVNGCDKDASNNPFEPDVLDLVDDLPTTYDLNSNTNQSYTVCPWVYDANGWTRNTDAYKQSIILDTVKPTVALNSTESGTSNLATIPLTITVADTNITHSLVVGDLTPTNASLSNFSGSNGSYTVDVEPVALGAVEIKVSAAQVTDLADNENDEELWSITYNGTIPVLTEVTAINSTTDTTPNYTFNSTEAGSITYGGSCSSAADTTAVVGDNVITFDTLAIGAYADCTITITNSFTNTDTLDVSGFSITTAVASSSGGGGGGGGGSSGPDLKTVYSVPSSESDKVVELNRPVKSKTGIYNREIVLTEYYLKSTFTIPKGTTVTDQAGELYTDSIGVINKTRTTKFESVPLLDQTLVYKYIFTIAGDLLKYSQPIKSTLVLPASLKNFTENYKTYSLWVYDDHWHRYAGPEVVIDGKVNFELDHSVYLAFVYEPTAKKPEQKDADTEKDVSEEDITGEEPVDTVQEIVTEEVEDVSIVSKSEVLNNLKDVQGHWAEDYIVDLYQQGVVKGRGDTMKFFPDETINRAGFLKIMLELFDYEIKDGLENPFSDVPNNAWFTPYVLTAYHTGIVKGYDDGTTSFFKPEKNINRAEALKIMFLSAQIELPEVMVAHNFNDVAPGSWFEAYVSFAKDKEIVKGKANNMFFPSDLITRAESVKVGLKTRDFKTKDFKTKD